MNIAKQLSTLLFTFAALALHPIAHAQSQAPASAPTLAVGATAPALTLPDQDGKSHTLSADKGKTILLAFYPADFTGGCTIEAHSLTAAHKDLLSMGVQVYGISVQDSKSHKAFCTQEGIPYTLLADTEKAASKTYGVLNAAGSHANRVTFIIAPDGKIAYIDKSVNSHLQTCGDDWVKWLKAHPQPVRTSSLRTIDIETGLTPTAPSPALASSSTVAALGKPAPAFTLPNALTGTDTSLVSVLAGKRAAVVMFISTRCPISNAYDERMTAIASQYAAQNVAFLAINANYNEPLAEVKTHTLDHKFPFAVLKDAANKTSDAYDAHVTPETYVIGSDGLLKYHGRIDNSDDPSQVTTHDLAAALDQVLAGQPVAKPSTKAFGCTIKKAP